MLPESSTCPSAADAQSHLRGNSDYTQTKICLYVYACRRLSIVFSSRWLPGGKMVNRRKTSYRRVGIVCLYYQNRNRKWATEPVLHDSDLYWLSYCETVFYCFFFCFLSSPSFQAAQKGGQTPRRKGRSQKYWCIVYQEVTSQNIPFWGGRACIGQGAWVGGPWRGATLLFSPPRNTESPGSRRGRS